MPSIGYAWQAKNLGKSDKQNTGVNRQAKLRVMPNKITARIGLTSKAPDKPASKEKYGISKSPLLLWEHDTLVYFQATETSC